MSNSIVIDGHGHACGGYLTAAQIENKLTAASTDIVLLTPGQYILTYARLAIIIILSENKKTALRKVLHVSIGICVRYIEFLTQYNMVSYFHILLSAFVYGIILSLYSQAVKNVKIKPDLTCIV